MRREIKEPQGGAFGGRAGGLRLCVEETLQRRGLGALRDLQPACLPATRNESKDVRGDGGGRAARSLQSQRPEEARVSRIGDRPQGTLEPRAVGPTAPRRPAGPWAAGLSPPPSPQDLAGCLAFGQLGSGKGGDPGLESWPLHCCSPALRPQANQL